MTYAVALLSCFVLWSVYALPGNAAEKIHGVGVNMAFETMAFILVTMLLGSKILAALPQVTLKSAALGTAMGLGSALGFYFFLTALSLAPGTRGMVLVLLVAGLSFPMQGILFALMGEPLATRQWLAVAGMTASIVVYNWR
jgi:hypothetical protein